ncbi:Uncharacterised protein [Chlamydia trachomatis]|nr:Uncharacterised protein [Chlamydia trachomatis]
MYSRSICNYSKDMQMEKYFFFLPHHKYLLAIKKTKQPENSNHSSHPINAQPECLTMLYDNREIVTMKKRFPPAL